MEERQKQDERIELRSEKVRSIVGQIPSLLVRYGITAIGLVLVCLFTVAHFLPYKQVYSGTAVIDELPIVQSGDSLLVVLPFTLTERRPSDCLQGCYPLTFQSGKKIADGTLYHLSLTCDTLGRQKAICNFPRYPLLEMRESEVDFRLTVRSGSLFSHFFSGLFGR